MWQAKAGDEHVSVTCWSQRRAADSRPHPAQPSTSCEVSAWRTEAQGVQSPWTVPYPQAFLGPPEATPAAVGSRPASWEPGALGSRVQPAVLHRPLGTRPWDRRGQHVLVQLLTNLHVASACERTVRTASLCSAEATDNRQRQTLRPLHPSVPAASVLRPSSRDWEQIEETGRINHRLGSGLGGLRVN